MNKSRLWVAGVAFEAAGLLGAGFALAGLANDGVTYDETANQVQTGIAAGEMSVAEGMGELRAEHEDRLGDYANALASFAAVVVGAAVCAAGDSRRKI